MKNINLAYQAPDYSLACSPSNGKQTTKTVYPEFTIRDQPELASQFPIGTEVEVTMKIKVVAIKAKDNDDYDSDMIEFQVISIEAPDQKPNGVMSAVKKLLKEAQA